VRRKGAWGIAPQVRMGHVVVTPPAGDDTF